MSAFADFIKGKLQKRRDDYSLRSLKNVEGLIDFTSNDYLGLARSKALYDRTHTKLQTLKLHDNGATGSRLLSGNSWYVEDVEKKLASIFNSEASLIFNSGYTANLAVLSSIPQKGDTILYDELAHACIKDGARLSLANRFSFRHNDLNDLESKLKKSTGKLYIAVESIYSMDGDQCPLQDLVKLSEKYDAAIILDEAHSTGVFGKGGSGLATTLKLEDKIAIRVYTFGKAMGCHGACVAGSDELIQYLINFARPFIYTTALPSHNIATIECAFDFLAENVKLQNGLSGRIELFNSLTKHLHNKIKSESAIQSIVIPGNENVRAVSDYLQKKGFDVRPILSPTVQEGKERLRICLHTFNMNEQIDELVRVLRTSPHLF